MSKIDITTRDLYKRLGSDSRSRSVRADALFRRLRTETQPTTEELLSGAPRKISIGDGSQRLVRRTPPSEISD